MRLSRMSTEISRIGIPVIILVVSSIVFWLLINKPEEKTDPLAEEDVPEVEAVPVTRHEGRLDISVDGQAIPYREIKLSAEVAGRIVMKAEEAHAGRFTDKDKILFEIDDQDYKFADDQLASQLQQAADSLQELDEEIAGAQRLVDLGNQQLRLAQQEYDRQKDLFQRKASSASELDQARRDVINAQNALTTVDNQCSLLKTRRSRLEQAEKLTKVKKKKAEYDLTRTKIKAPVDGVIVSDFVEEGDYVTIGTPLLTIEDTSAVEVKCNLRMDELYWVWDQAGRRAPGEFPEKTRQDYQLRPTQATVIYRLEGKEYVWFGELWRIEGVGLDERTRTVPCRVIVRQPQKVWSRLPCEQPTLARDGPPALVRGMYVDVIIHVEPSTPLLQVPERALRPGGRVWVAQPKEDDDEEAPESATHYVKFVHVDVVEVASREVVVRATSGNLAKGSLVIVSPLANPAKPAGGGTSRVWIRVKPAFGV